MCGEDELHEQEQGCLKKQQDRFVRFQFRQALSTFLESKGLLQVFVVVV